MDYLHLLDQGPGVQAGSAPERFVAFEGWPEPHLDRLIDLASVETLAPGDVLFEAGDEADDLFILVEGTLGVDLPFVDTGVREIRPFSIIGEVAFIDRRPRSASIHALTDARVARIGRSDVDELAAAEPEVALALVTEIARCLAFRLRQRDQIS